MPSQVDAAKLRRAVMAPARLWVRGVLIFFGIMTVYMALGEGKLESSDYEL